MAHHSFLYVEGRPILVDHLVNSPLAALRHAKPDLHLPTEHWALNIHQLDNVIPIDARVESIFQVAAATSYWVISRLDF